MKVAEARDGDIILRIFQDEDPIDQREMCDYLGKMVCWHRMYNLGDKHDFETPDDFLNSIDKERSILLPLYLYDHSGLRMKVGSFNGLLPQGHAEWDTMQVGWIYCSHEYALDECKWGQETDGETLAKAERMLCAEVKEYDQYLNGDIYGFNLIEVEHCDLGHEHEEVMDSCWGFYGYGDWKENGMMEHVPEEYQYLFDRLEDCQ